MIDTLRVNFTAGDLIGQSCFQNVLDLNITDRTVFHRKQIILSMINCMSGKFLI